MDEIEIVLWIAIAVLAILYKWIGKSVIAQPTWNTPMIFRTQVIGQILVSIPPIGFLVVVITGFMLTEHGWWFLVAIIVVSAVFAPRLR